ncbi:MAG TPA: PrgI family protein [Candidatus Paceibacterota bacterium]|nr:PrgI family protein [Candidatus Paceibacterota bacterium]
MQFQIPQFIEVEDKIFGPLTFRQFVYLAGGAGAAYLLWRVLPLIIAGPLIGGVVGLAGALAFMQYNGRPFILALEHAFSYLLHPKLYLWNNERKRSSVKATKLINPTAPAEVYVPKLSDSKLHELSWSLDIKERIAAGIGSDEDVHSSGDVVRPVMVAREARIV